MRAFLKIPKSRENIIHLLHFTHHHLFQTNNVGIHKLFTFHPSFCLRITLFYDEMKYNNNNFISFQEKEIETLQTSSWILFIFRLINIWKERWWNVCGNLPCAPIFSLTIGLCKHFLFSPVSRGVEANAQGKVKRNQEIKIKFSSHWNGWKMFG